MKNKWIWVGLVLVVGVSLIVWGVRNTMCLEAIC
jgi:hypothetical protein